MRDNERFIIDLNKKRETAWQQLYEEFYPALCTYVAKLTHENVGVEDIVQECMIGLWDSSLQFPNVKSLAGWLYKAVYNRALNMIRDRDNARRLLGNYTSEISYTEEMAIDLAIEESVIAKFRSVLSELSDQQRQVMNLSLEGLKVREIAQLLEVSENTVKMQKKRAYAYLRERMGMVFGYVQSGKTAHYIGMINKAYDAGYRIVIVLSGIHNSLRSQTQSRIDEEVLGYETSLESIGDMTRERNAIGVGIGPYNQVETPVQSITTRDEKGDVNKKTEGVSMMPPLMVVTKKNASVLRKILRFFRKNYCAEIIGGKKKIPAKYPALIIDDEADQASINTRASYDDQGNILDDYNPTTINGLIRELLNIFECRSYVGYTATPLQTSLFLRISTTKDMEPICSPEILSIELPEQINILAQGNSLDWAVKTFPQCRFTEKLRMAQAISVKELNLPMQLVSFPKNSNWL